MQNPDQSKVLGKSKAKYELTLAEFPIFLLSKSAGKDIKVIEYEDTINGKEGKLVKREWKVYPDSKLGFGTASTFETLFDLFQIWKEDNFESQFIQFGTIYNLLKRRGIGLNHKAYERMRNDLSCLVGIKIEAKRAFWDNEAKSYVTKIFHIFDEVDIYESRKKGDQAQFPFGRIKASDVIFGSVLTNSVLATDFDAKFYYKLTPIEQRLALYLTKIFRSQASNKRELMEFASQIPIHSKLPKHAKAEIKKACAGLMEKGFPLLASCDFEKGADRKSEYVIFRRQGSPPKPKIPIQPKDKQKRLLPATINPAGEGEYLIETIMEFCGDQKSLNFYKKVVRLVDSQTIFRALSEARASDAMKETKKSKAAHFTYLIRKYAQEQGIKI